MLLIHNQSLDFAAAEIVARFGGDWREGHGLCLCPAHPDTIPSLSVRVGQRSLLFKCFAGCETADVLRAVRAHRLAIPVMAEKSLDRSGDGRRSRLALARRIWANALFIRSGLAGRYLSNRGLEDRPACLRFHPRTPLRINGILQFRPAIIAAVCEANELVAIQRTFLHPLIPQVASDLPHPKLTLAIPQRGVVQLRPAAPVLGLAEGVETAMSASLLLGIPVWATLGAERLHNILLPHIVRRLILLPDNDLPGRRAGCRAVASYGATGLDVDLVWPWGGMNDWSDVLADRWALGGKGGVDRTRDAA